MESGQFAEKNAKIFVTFAKVFAFLQKILVLPRLSTIQQKLDSQGTLLIDGYVNSEGSTKLISTGKREVSFRGNTSTFLGVFLSQRAIFIQGRHGYVETLGNVLFGIVRNFCLIPHKGYIRGYLGHGSGLNEFQ